MASAHRGWKICAAVTGIFVIIISVVLLVLFLTVLKIKEPDIVARPIQIESFKITSPTGYFNVTVGVLITVKNPNYGSFKYENTTAYISYHGNVVAEAPFENGTIPSHKKHNIRTSLVILADRMVADSHFIRDLLAGVFNFTSHTTVHGKGSLLKIFHKKVVSNTDCNITMTIGSQNVDSACITKIKLW